MSLLLTIWEVFSRVLAFLGIPRWLPAAGIAGALVLVGAYWKGHHDAAEACQEAGLRTQIATLQRDLAAADAASHLEAAQAAELEDQRQKLSQKVADYEAALKTRPEARCTLSTDDVRALGGLHGKRRK